MVRPRTRLLPLPLSFAMSLGLTSSALAQDFLDPAIENDLGLSRVVNNLGGPTAAEFLPDGRMVIIQQGGDVLLWDGNNLSPAGTLNVQAGGERGLLGMAIDPMFAATNRIYFYFSTGGAQAVGWTTLDPGTGQLDTAALANNILVEGLSANRNHDGGGLHFGPDGHLYIGVGDTGCNCGCAPGTNTDNFFPTCLTKYHGKILRIDRDGNIPPTNPLVGVKSVTSCGAGNACGDANDPLGGSGPPLPEIYNWGFRNPWRFSFDEQTGYLWIGDVGEVTLEEITISTGPGEHHGWPYREGDQGQGNMICQTATPQAAGPCKEPAYVYNHNEAPAAGQGSVTGGVFSNHCSWPAPWQGLYWFGDYNKTRVWTLTPNQARDGVEPNSRQIIVRSAGGPVHFFGGPDGAIYYTTINDGEIWRIAPATPAACPMMDAGVIDMGEPGPDMGAPDPDMGTPVEDMGEPGPDMGPAPDMGAVEDAGDKPVPDMGVQAPDAGSAAVDMGAGGGGGDGCDCTSAQAGQGTFLFGLLLLGLLAIRLRRS